MECHTGRCIGGPYDGQMMDHWAREKKFYRPMIAFNGIGLNAENAPIEAVEIGSYKLGDFSHWHWFETEAGKSYRNEE